MGDNYGPIVVAKADAGPSGVPTTELPAVFGFLFDLTLGAMNWRAEQAIVNRKVSGESIRARGETRAILSSTADRRR